MRQAVVVLALACWGSSQSAEGVRMAEETCRSGGAMQGQPVVPEGVLLQMLIVDPRGREAGYRIYDDGRFERRSVGGPWVTAPALTPEQQQAARSAIRSAGLDRLEQRYEPATRDADDGNSVVHVDASDGGVRRSVAVVRPCKVPEVDALIVRMDEILRAAR